jgi:hypothetical protein
MELTAMNLVSVRWKRSRRGLFRAVAVICALAAVSYGAVAVTAAPARADQTITPGGPVTASYTSGDLVATEDVPGIAPAVISNFLATAWPEAVGLSAGASLTAIYQATWQSDSSTWTNPSTQGFPDPPNSSGGSATVTSDGSGGSTVTIDVPAATVSANINLPDWLTGALSQMAGVAAAVVSWSICEPLVLTVGGAALVTTGPGGAALTAAGSAICGGIAATMWTFASSVVGRGFSNKPFTPEFWLSMATECLTAFVGGALVGFMAPALRWVFKKLVSWLVTGITNIVTFIKPYIGSAYQGFVNGVQRLLRRGQNEVQEGLPMWNLPNIPVTNGRIVDEGYFEAYPFGGGAGAASPSSYCMDAYGSNGDPSAGQIVAINTCDQGASQLADVYPDGMVSIGGLCLDTTGGTSSIGTPLVNLEPCDGSSSQQWTQVGSTVVNQAASDCLDEPNGSTASGTQLDVSPCDGSAAQNWLSPAALTCDIYAANGTACVAAYSMTRALYASYDGPLYQVQRASDNTTTDIGLLGQGGDVNASAQDSFCSATTCTITEIYDQSPMGNNLTIEGAGGNGPADHGAVANALPVKIGGNEAYGLDVEPGVGYRADSTQGVATDGEPEGMYMVASGTHVNSGCCFDFGNAEANNDDTGAGHMDAVNLTTWCGSNSAPCTGSGPWVEADMENGQWMGNGSNPNNTGNSTPFVTAMLDNNGQDTFALSGGDSTSGGLSQWYDGALPSGYAPMQQEGAIVLGTGGDNSQSAVGSWFEGVMTAGYPSSAANSAVQASIVAAKYTGNTNPSGSASGTAPSAAGQAVVHSAGATGAGASGFSSVYTVDSANGHLQETYLPYIGDSWTTQDLSATGGDLPGTPPVMPGTEPVAIVHCGFTSVYTVDADSGDLQETYLPAIGDAWSTQDLTASYHTPPTNATPTAVVHAAGATGAAAACGFTSVYTRDRNGDLQETYLPYIGDSWTTQDLSGTGGTLPGTPAILAGTSPVAIVHCGFTSVYTVDGNHNLQETYLPAIGDSWTTQDLSGTGGTLPGTPDTTVTPTAVVHTAGATGAAAACGFTSVYTVDQSNSDLQETYLPAIGGPWTTQNLSANYGTPAVAPGAQPVALDHTGYTSVYTVDEGSDHVQETYLAAIGDSWATQDLTAKYGTPQTTETPIVLLHPDASGNLTWTSVYTTGEFNDHLQETYLAAIGDSWVTQDLTAKYGTLEVSVADSPTAGSSVDHDGYTSVYTVAANGDLEESYLSAIGKSWVVQDLSGTGGTLPGTPKVMSGSQPVALVHDGYTSVYTVDQNGDLQETYLSAIGNSWVTQDLSANYHTPQVQGGSSPSAVFHDGYTSVYTLDSGDGNLQETYLPAIGKSWVTQDLAHYGTPQAGVDTSPSAIVHSGFVSVYTVDAGNNDLQETYLPAIGDSWVTQDLSAGPDGTPPVAPFTSPAAIVHSGWVSVYTDDQSGASNGESGDLQETYLPAIGDSWTTQDLSTNSHIPQVSLPFSPVAVYHTGYTSVYTINSPNDGSSGDDLQESYLSAIGNSWSTQDLSANYKVPYPDQILSALVHYDPNGGLTWTSVFTLDVSTGQLQETYLSVIGNGWSTQTLAGTPAGGL